MKTKILLPLLAALTMSLTSLSQVSFGYSTKKHIHKSDGQTKVLSEENNGGTITLGEFFVKIKSPNKVEQFALNWTTLKKIEEGHYIAFDDLGTMYSFIGKGQLLLIASRDTVLMYNLSVESSNVMNAYISRLFNSKK